MKGTSELPSFCLKENKFLLVSSIGKPIKHYWPLKIDFRFTDFLVNEITQDGQVVKPPPKRDPNARVQEEKKEPEEFEEIVLKPEAEAVFKKTISPDDFLKLLKFIEEVNLYDSG